MGNVIDITIDGEHYRHVERGVWNLSGDAARTAFERYCRCLFVRLYVYYRRSTSTAHGQISIEPEHPGDGWELGDAAFIPRHLTVDALTRWMHERLRTLPILRP